MKRLVVGLLLLAVLPSARVMTVAGQVPTVRLGEPDATFPEAFALIQRTRELPDGRVIVADPLGQVLVVADLSTGRADTLGGLGQGPGEYRQPDAVFPLPGDSTLLVDLGNARLTAIGPAGEFAETWPIAQGEPGPGGGLLILLPRGVDSDGRIYFQPVGGGRGPQLPDSAAVVRWSRADGSMDTITRVKLPGMTRATAGGAGNQNVRIAPRPLSPQDTWAVAWDGRVAVARAGDYHLEWVDADGETVVGPRVTYEPVEIRSSDKEEWLEEQGNGLAISMSVENGRGQMSFRRGGGDREQSQIDALEWPTAKPAFRSGGVWVAPDGTVWVHRHVPAGAPAMFDRFDSRAVLVSRIEAPKGREIVGFGRESVFLVRTDDLGLQWLERYRLPADL